MRRLYTVEQVDQTLPYVRVVVGEIKELYGKLKALGKDHNALPREEAEERARLRGEIQEVARLLRTCQEELEQIGAALEDYELGLVDFPAEMEGRPILLCWKDGEEGLSHWHEVDANHTARQPVPAGIPGWPEGATVSSRARE